MSLPLVRLHSMDFIRGFVAVGRRMSITLAAEDLCLTQSAVSRQVHALEEAMGLKLLNRGYRSISFTAEGERLFRVADMAVRQLQDVMGALDARGIGKPVTISASIGVTALWLLPRLASLHRRFPGIDVRVAANNKLLDLRDDSVDIAIRYGPEGTEPEGAERLFGEELVPVAHPSLGLSGIAPAKVVASQVLLEFEDARRPWMQWQARLRALGLEAVKPRGMLRFNQYDQVVYAATGGQGVALGRRPLIEPMLKDGRLVELPWGGKVAQPRYAYWLILANGGASEDVATVAQWIREEAVSP
jgi:LysR family transcriptional regulator, glycine cleavage system transcriptional activator